MVESGFYFNVRETQLTDLLPVLPAEIFISLNFMQVSHVLLTMWN